MDDALMQIQLKYVLNTPNTQENRAENVIAIHPEICTLGNQNLSVIFYIQFSDKTETVIKFINYENENFNLKKKLQITSFFAQISIKEGDEDPFYVNAGIINLTNALDNQKGKTTFKSPHVNGDINVFFNTLQSESSDIFNPSLFSTAVKLKNASPLAIQDAYLKELEADSTLYQTYLESILKKYSPRVLGSYDLNFARQVHLFYAPSELSYKDGTQVKLNPCMHFLRHRTFDAKLLESLAHLAFISTYAYDGEEKRIVDFQNVSKLSGADACFATQVFSRYLALLPNLVKYEYDYDFVFKKDPTRRISDMFGDCLVNFTGDCEDASRLVADIWRATAEMETGNPYLKCMKQVQGQFDLYCTLCTIQSNANMAHCTCILVPIGGQKSAFPFAIVEGTNAISPFAATGIPEELSRKADMKMLGQYEVLHDSIMKNEKTQLEIFKKKMESERYDSTFFEREQGGDDKKNAWMKNMFFLSEKPTTKMSQTIVGKMNRSGRAESVVSWYGLFHEGFKISAKNPDAPPEPFLFVKKETSTYGVSAEEMKNMDFKAVSLSIANTEQQRKCIEHYKELTQWHDSKEMVFKKSQKEVELISVKDNEHEKIITVYPQSRNNNEITWTDIIQGNYRLKDSERHGLPVFTVHHEYKGYASPRYLSSVNQNVLEFKNDPVLYTRLKIVVSDNLTIYAGVHFVPTSRINVDARAPATSQAMATYRTVMAPFGAAAQRKLYPCSDASLVAAVAARYQQVTGQKLALRPNVDVGTLVRRSTTKPSEYEKKQKVSAQPPAAVKAHPLSGCSGNLIQAIQALRIGPHMDGTDKMQDSSFYVFRNNSAEDVRKTVKLARKMYPNLDQLGIISDSDLHVNHMQFLKNFAREEDNGKHAIALAWNMYNHPETTKKDHTLLMNRVHHIIEEAHNMLHHSGVELENFGVEEYKKARNALKGVEKGLQDGFKRVKTIISKTHKKLIEAAGVDKQFSDAMNHTRYEGAGF